MGLVQSLEADLKLGAQRSNEELAIAALVVAPFTLTAGVFVSWLIWSPTLIAVLVTVVLQLAAMVWNAGWRARDE